MAQGRIIYCPLANLVIANNPNDDVWHLTAGANNKLRLLGFEIYSNQTTAAALRFRLLRRTGAPTGGDAATEVKADEDDGNITAVMLTEVTGPGTAGDVLAEFHWEQLGPLVFAPTPQLQPVVQEGGRIALEVMDSPGTPTWCGWVAWEEI